MAEALFIPTTNNEVLLQKIAKESLHMRKFFKTLMIKIQKYN